MSAQDEASITANDATIKDMEVTFTLEVLMSHMMTLTIMYNTADKFEDTF